MKKLSSKWLVLEHYQQAIEAEIDGVTVKVWKPSTMGLLPAYEMFSVLRKYADNFHELLLLDDLKSSKWFTGNPDYGCWDAQLALRYDPRRMVVDVYVCALLCRPYSREARAFYERRCGLSPLERLRLMWDSRDFDEAANHETVFGFQNSEAARRVFSVVSPNTDITENCSSSESASGSVRTTICVDPVLYRSFKTFAVSHGTTVTALLKEAMKDILSQK